MKQGALVMQLAETHINAMNYGMYMYRWVCTCIFFLKPLIFSLRIGLPLKHEPFSLAIFSGTL